MKKQILKLVSFIYGPLKIKETGMKSIDNQPKNFFTEVNISFTFYAISWEYIFQVFKLIKSC